MSVTIIGDSACDMTQEEAAQRGVILLPLKTIIDGEEYLDGVTITHEEFYEKLNTCQELPSTSQVSPAAFADHYGTLRQRRKGRHYLPDALAKHRAALDAEWHVRAHLRAYLAQLFLA